MLPAGLCGDAVVLLVSGEKYVHSDVGYLPNIFQAKVTLYDERKKLSPSPNKPALSPPVLPFIRWLVPQ